MPGRNSIRSPMRRPPATYPWPYATCAARPRALGQRARPRTGPPPESAQLARARAHAASHDTRLRPEGWRTDRGPGHRPPNMVMAAPGWPPEPNDEHAQCNLCAPEGGLTSGMELLLQQCSVLSLPPAGKPSVAAGVDHSSIPPEPRRHSVQQACGAQRQPHSHHHPLQQRQEASWSKICGLGDIQPGDRDRDT